MISFSNLLLNSKKTQWFIFAIACLLYINTIPNKWVMDDSVIIHQNSYVKRGVSGIGKTLTTDAFSGFYGKDINAVAGGRWRPLTPTLFAIEAELFASAKKDVNQVVEKDEEGFKIKDLSEKTWFPNLLHFFNILWYGLLCLVLYRTVLLLLQFKKEENNFKSNFIAFVSTLLYTVHPLHTEAVANVKGLDEILALLGALASLYCVLKILALPKDSPNKKWFLGAIGTYFMALLTKETAITFIAIIPLALWFFTTASVKTIFKLCFPLILILFVFMGIRATVLYEPNKGEIGKELMNNPFLVLDKNAKFSPLVLGSEIMKLDNPTNETFIQMPFNNKLATNIYTYGVYLKLLVAPYPLTIDYYPRHIEIKTFSDASVLLPLLIHLFLLIWALFHFRKKNVFAFGILYYFITFSIVSNLFFPIGTNMAERFMFMPSVGFCLAVAYLLYNLGTKLSTTQTDGFKIIKIALIVICTFGAILTINRNFDWKDDFTILSKDILVSKNSGKINADLAGFYISKALGAKETTMKEIEDLTVSEKKEALNTYNIDRDQMLETAIPLAKKALEIQPMSNRNWMIMANAYHFLGKSENNDPKVNFTNLTIAQAAYKQAEIYNALNTEKSLKDYKALCYMDMGKLMGQKFNDINTAISYLEQAKTLAPKEPEIYLLLGTSNSMLNNYEKAIEYTKKSLELRPNDRDTKENLAVAYQQYANANASKKDLLPIAEKMLLEVLNEEKKLNDNDLNKQKSMIRTLDLLYRNATIQGNSTKQNEYKTELLKLNPNQLL